MFKKDYFNKHRLCLVTDRKISKKPLAEAVAEAVSAGVNIVQLREKDLSTKEYFELARQIKIICRKYSAVLIINDRIDIAQAIDADGVHLGWQSIPCHIARHILGQEKIIGISIHSLNEATDAQGKNADYITLGPVFPTVSKEGLIEPLGLNKFREIKKNLRIPVLAIGGIKINNLADVIKTEANGVAIISEILQSENISQTVKDIKNYL